MAKSFMRSANAFMCASDLSAVRARFIRLEIRLCSLCSGGRMPKLAFMGSNRRSWAPCPLSPPCAKTTPAVSYIGDGPDASSPSDLNICGRPVASQPPDSRIYVGSDASQPPDTYRASAPINVSRGNSTAGLPFAYKAAQTPATNPDDTDST